MYLDNFTNVVPEKLELAVLHSYYWNWNWRKYSHNIFLEVLKYVLLKQVFSAKWVNGFAKFSHFANFFLRNTLLNANEKFSNDRKFSFAGKPTER